MQSRDLSRGCKRARGVSSSLHGCVRVKREEKQLCLCFCMPDNAYSHQTVLLPHAPLTDTVGPSISRFPVRISFEWTRMRVTGSATVWFEGSPVIDDHGPPPRTYTHTHTQYLICYLSFLLLHESPRPRLMNEMWACPCVFTKKVVERNGEREFALCPFQPLICRCVSALFFLFNIPSFSFRQSHLSFCHFVLISLE